MSIRAYLSREFKLLRCVKSGLSGRCRERLPSLSSCAIIHTDMEAVVPKVFTVSHWVTVADYAKASGIRTRSAFLRLKRGVVAHARIQSLDVVDIRLSPPARKLPRKAPKAPRLTWPEGLPSAENLVLASTFCEMHTTRGHAFYRAILRGEVTAWLIAGHLFVEKSLDPEPFRRHPAPPITNKRRYNRGW